MNRVDNNKKQKNNATGFKPPSKKKPNQTEPNQTKQNKNNKKTMQKQMEQIAFDWRRCLEDVTAAAPDRLVISSIRSIRFASVFHPAATDPSHRIQFEKPLANWFRKFRLQFSAKTQTRPSIGKLRQNWTALPDRLQKIFHNEQNRPKIPKFENVNSDNKKK